MIYTDSQYVKNGIQTWIHGWKRNGWKTARQEAGQERGPVAASSIALAARFDIEWHWVKGHNDTPGNERADALANRGVEQVAGFAG